jgi:hypothetical protein
VRVFWKRREREMPGWPEGFGSLADPPETPARRPLAESIEIGRGASRAVAISLVIEELRRRGEKAVEVLGMVSAPAGQATMPIHLRRGREDVFVEVESGPWERRTVDEIL